MKKEQILRNSKDFSLLYQRGRRLNFSFFQIIFRKSLLPYPRFAFVTARAVDTRAVKRNLVRRRAREWLRKRALFSGMPLDILFIFKKGVTAIPRAQFYAEFERAVKKITF